MDKAYEYTKSAIVNFKLDRCCCFAPIRAGVLVIGYFNLFIAILLLVGVSDGGITPPLMEIQGEDNESKSIAILAYSSDSTFSILLIYGMYHNDIMLLCVYVYYMLANIATSSLLYSLIAVESALTKMLVIGTIVYNAYVILIVRSAIVEIRETETSEKNGHVTLYSVTKVPQEDVPDVEAPPEPSEPISEEQKCDDNKDEKTDKVETVDENIKNNN